MHGSAIAQVLSHYPSGAGSMTPAPIRAIAIFDIDGVLRDVGGSYRRALADTVEHYTQGQYRPSQADIDELKAEGCWNNDWEGSQELVYRYFERQGQARSQLGLVYDDLVDFFQRRYRGPDPTDPDQWTGYICQEPLLVAADYFDHLTAAGVAWGFFSGATRGSAQYVLERRIGLVSPPLIAMEDAPGKPDPTGLFQVVAQLEQGPMPANLPVIYAGDTVADLQTIHQAQQQQPQRSWHAVGILPPHAQVDPAYQADYAALLSRHGATVVLPSVQALQGAVLDEVLA
jgi:HAD superfamily phosphatase